MSPKWGLNPPPRLLQVWAVSCSLLPLPGPSSLPPSIVGTGVPNPVFSAPVQPCRFGTREFSSQKIPSSLPPTQSQAVWGVRSRGALWPHSYCPNPTRGTRTEAKTQSAPHPALGSRRGHRAERLILVLGDSDSSRRDSPGRGLV